MSTAAATTESRTRRLHQPEEGLMSATVADRFTRDFPEHASELLMREDIAAFAAAVPTANVRRSVELLEAGVLSVSEVHGLFTRAVQTWLGSEIGSAL